MSLVRLLVEPTEAMKRLGGLEVGEGTQELWCIERDGDRAWKLEFSVPKILTALDSGLRQVYTSAIQSDIPHR